MSITWWYLLDIYFIALVEVLGEYGQLYLFYFIIYHNMVGYITFNITYSSLCTSSSIVFIPCYWTAFNNWKTYHTFMEYIELLILTEHIFDCLVNFKYIQVIWRGSKYFLLDRSLWNSSTSISKQISNIWLAFMGIKWIVCICKAN